MTTTATAELNLVEAVRDALFLELERDDRVVVLGMDVGPLGGVFRATDGLVERFGEARILNTSCRQLPSQDCAL